VEKWRTQKGGKHPRVETHKGWKEVRAQSYGHTFIHGSERGRDSLFVFVHRLLNEQVRVGILAEEGASAASRGHWAVESAVHERSGVQTERIIKN